MNRTATPLRRSRLRSGGKVRARRKTRKGQIPEAVLDALASKYIRARDPVCKMRGMVGGSCDRGGTVWAHFITRTYRNTRWDEENTYGICARHHALVHANPVLGGELWARVIGGVIKCSWLWAKAQAVAKVDRHAVKAHLQSLLVGQS